MKRIITMILVTLLLLTVTTSANMPARAEQESQTEETTNLSDMSEAECLAFLENAGVEMPGADNKLMDWGAFAKSVITVVEANPNYRFVFGYTVAQKFADDICNAVRTYYGWSDQIAYQLSRTTYALTDSTVLGEWNNQYKFYNCYGYAIDEYEYVDPGYFSGNDLEDIDSLEPSNLARLVKLDLKSLGWDCVVTSDTIPSSSVFNSSKNVICVRAGGGIYPGTLTTVFDYHFMCYNNGSWYHKPGGTIPLRYNSTPSNDVYWTNECVTEDGPQAGWITYASEIYFITYTGSHSSYHSYSYIGSGKHQKTCGFCDEVVTSSCTSFTYSYCGNGTTTHTHQKKCADCKNVVATESCTFLQNSNKCSSCGYTKFDISINSLDGVAKQ